MVHSVSDRQEKHFAPVLLGFSTLPFRVRPAGNVSLLLYG